MLTAFLLQAFRRKELQPQNKIQRLIVIYPPYTTLFSKRYKSN